VWAERRTAGRIETAELCRFSDGVRSVFRREQQSCWQHRAIYVASGCWQRCDMEVILSAGCYVLTEMKFVPKPLMSCALLLVGYQRPSSSLRGTWHTLTSHCLCHAVTRWDIQCSGSSPEQCTKFLRGFSLLLQIVRCQLLELGHHHFLLRYPVQWSPAI